MSLNSSQIAYKQQDKIRWGNRGPFEFAVRWSVAVETGVPDASTADCCSACRPSGCAGYVRGLHCRFIRTNQQYVIGLERKEMSYSHGI
jgi:hypothetical protein